MEKRERKERSFIGKVLVFILTILAIVGLIAMALSVMSPHVNPKHFWWVAMFGLAFWEILLFNLFVLLALLLLWSRKAWIALIALLIAIPGFRKSYSFGKPIEQGDGIRIMSYNVHLFKHIDGTIDTENFANQIMAMVREQNPDLLCCQEFTAYKRGVLRPECIKLFSQGIGMPYCYYNTKRNYSGNVIFSRYPIAKVTDGDGFSKEETYGILVSVDAEEKGKFYLANIHLVSNMITNDEIDVLTKTSDNQQSFDTVGRKVIHKLKSAFIYRSDEVKAMLQGIPQTNMPLILCGDFNDTPLSYTYRRIQKAGYRDTFIEVGHGSKPTYAGKLPLIRIDYFWANDKVTPLRFERYRKKASDHYPIILDFSINNK